MPLQRASVLIAGKKGRWAWRATNGGRGDIARKTSVVENAGGKHTTKETFTQKFQIAAATSALR